MCYLSVLNLFILNIKIMKMLLFTVIIILIIIIISYISEKYNDRNRLMKDLTGSYTHTKTIKGIVIKVQYKNRDNKLNYRTATKKEIKILKRFKYL